MTDWTYDPPTTVLGQLQRGLGRGAVHAVRDSAAAAVLDCVRRDCRWDWQVDERAGYLARVARDLRLPVGQIAAILDTADDEENTLRNVVAVLLVLARGGDSTAIDGLRRYVHTGPEWVTVLESVAAELPRSTWDDLLAVARARLARGNENAFWDGSPWREWAGADEAIAARVDAASGRAGRANPLAAESTGSLLATVRSGAAGQRLAALTELDRRGPQPALLNFVDELVVDGSALAELRGPLNRALRHLGAQALPLARTWETSEHPLIWTAYWIMAEHGTQSDLPALLRGWDWLAERADDLCGYDVLATGLARVGGPDAVAVLPRLRQVWPTPHSYERAAYLHAMISLAPDQAGRYLAEGVLDCEPGVRALAAQHVALDDTAVARLRYLRDDPLEDPAVRQVAAARLA